MDIGFTREEYLAACPTGRPRKERLKERHRLGCLALAYYLAGGNMELAAEILGCKDNRLYVLASRACGGTLPKRDKKRPVEVRIRARQYPYLCHGRAAKHLIQGPEDEVDAHTAFEEYRCKRCAIAAYFKFVRSVQMKYRAKMDAKDLTNLSELRK